MYCRKCGKELVNSEKFCPHCGTNQIPKMSNMDKTAASNKRKQVICALCIAAMTSPILFIIRMLSVTTKFVPAGSGGAWRDYTAAVVPENIQAIMIVLLIASTIANIILTLGGKKYEPEHVRMTRFLVVINILIGLAVTLSEG